MAPRIKRYTPNILTIIRLFLGFALPFMDHKLRMICVGIAALTEFFDGFLARRWSVQSNLGQILDPVADKIFVLCLCFTIAWEGHISYFDLAMIGFRDVAVLISAGVAIGLFGVRSIVRFPARLMGKITTFFQFVFLVAVFFFDTHIYLLPELTCLVGVLSLGDYIQTFLKDSKVRKKKTETVFSGNENAV